MKKHINLLIAGTEKTMFSVKSHKERNNTWVKLFFTKLDHQWTELVKGKKAVELHDDGNGVTVKLRRKSFRLDYSELQETMLALKEYESLDDSGFDVYSYTKSKVTVK